MSFSSFGVKSKRCQLDFKVLDMFILRVHLYWSESERESDVTSNLLHCFQSVCLYCSDKKIKEKNRFRVRFRSSINEP